MFVNLQLRVHNDFSSFFSLAKPNPFPRFYSHLFLEWNMCACVGVCKFGLVYEYFVNISRLIHDMVFKTKSIVTWGAAHIVPKQRHWIIYDVTLSQLVCLNAVLKVYVCMRTHTYTYIWLRFFCIASLF